jgi:hypothetical protein
MKLCLLIAKLVTATLTVCSLGCVSGGGTKTNDSGVEITYPDPDDDKDAPKFCNPTGKKGQELINCYEFNDKIYQSVNDEAKKREPWFNFATDNWVDGTELDPSRLFAVTKVEEAVAKLETVSFVEISLLEVEQLTGQKASVKELKPYLLRSLVYFDDTGSFSVFEKNGSILVRHDSIGTTIPAEKRTGLVVFLATPPKEVYVDCQVAE